MSKVKRFDMRGDCWLSEDGNLVQYKDYAALEARVKELEQRAEAAERVAHKCAVKGLRDAAELERMKAQEPVQYQAEINGIMSSVTKSHYEDCVKYGVKTRKIYAEPRPAAAVPVKVPRKCPQRVSQVIYNECGGFVDCDANEQTIWNACRDEILRINAGEEVKS